MAELAKNLPVDISIHAPHEGVRRDVLAVLPATYHFNPRTPRGGATSWTVRHSIPRRFQSTHPTRGCDGIDISFSLDDLFQSTHPTRGCDVIFVLSGIAALFQSTHPTRGCDESTGKRAKNYKYFNPRTPRGGATRM